MIIAAVSASAQQEARGTTRGGLRPEPPRRRPTLSRLRHRLAAVQARDDGGAAAARPEPTDRPYPVLYTAPTAVRQALRTFQEASLPRTVAAALFDHAAILAIVVAALAAYTTLPLAAAVAINVVALVAVARFQRGLECLVHEASHYNWDRRHRGRNDALANLLAALPVFSRVQEYRVGHMVHHRKKGTHDDPDLQRYIELDIEALDRSNGLRYALGVARRLPRYVLGWWAAIRASRTTAAAALAWHAVAIFAPVAALAGPRTAALVSAQWMAAFVVTLPVVRFIGEAGEHHYVETGTLFQATMINAGWIHRLLIHPHNDGFHLVHHLWPSVPHHKLRRLHELLVEVDRAEYARRIRLRTRILEEPPNVPAAAAVAAGARGRERTPDSNRHRREHRHETGV